MFTLRPRERFDNPFDLSNTSLHLASFANEGSFVLFRWRMNFRSIIIHVHQQSRLDWR